MKLYSFSKLRDEIDRHRRRALEVLVDDPIAVIGALVDGDDEIATVVGDVAGEAPLGMIRPAIDQHVVALRRAEAVVIDLLEGEREELAALRLVEAAVEEALVVLRPRGRS